MHDTAVERNRVHWRIKSLSYTRMNDCEGGQMASILCCMCRLDIAGTAMSSCLGVHVNHTVIHTYCILQQKITRLSGILGIFLASWHSKAAQLSVSNSISGFLGVCTWQSLTACHHGTTTSRSLSVCICFES